MIGARLDALPPRAKAGLVVGGYVAALLAGAGVVAVYEMTTPAIAAQASAGMYAFSEAILFAAVFGAASTVPTLAALWFARRSRWFLRVVVLLFAAAVVVTAAALRLLLR